MSYYENRIKALEARVDEMAKRERMKAIPVEARLMDIIKEQKKQIQRLTNAGDCLVIHIEACYRAEGYDPKDCDMIDNWNAVKEVQS
jgi:hypothetical protein